MPTQETMTPPRLPVMYTFRRCPYAMRARLAVDVVGCQVAWREVALSDKPAALRLASPKATVPVWIGVDGQVIDESLAIMLHLLAALDDPDLNPQGHARERALAHIAECDGAFKYHLDRFKYHTRYPGEDPDVHRQALAEMLSEWDRQLAPRMSADIAAELAPGLADLAVLPFVRQCRIADPAWFDAQPWPHVHRWLARFLLSAAFERVMVKRAVWQSGT